MPLQICPKCKRFHYVPGPCPEVASSPSGKAAAAGRGKRKPPSAPKHRKAVDVAVEKIERKVKRKGDRHRPGYWAEYGKKRRAAAAKAEAK